MNRFKHSTATAATELQKCVLPGPGAGDSGRAIFGSGPEVTER